MEAARNIWVVVLYRRLEPAGCELALFSFYLDFTHPIQWCKGSGVRVRVDPTAEDFGLPRAVQMGADVLVVATGFKQALCRRLAV